jgi:hypothetical protein
MIARSYWWFYVHTPDLLEKERATQREVSNNQNHKKTDVHPELFN